MTGYRTELDGLRCIAILPVIVFHLNPDLMPGGFLGVDVFFVLSGFLISSRILPQIFSATSDHSFSLANFFYRRIKRLLPASLVLIAAVQGFGGLLLLDSEWQFLSKQSLAALPAGANIFFWWHTGNYWSPAAETMPLLHTWSLSVEEQFYFIFPSSLLLIRKYSVLKRVRLCVLGACTAVSLAAFVFCRRYAPDAGFFLAPLRAWELLAGCLLAEAQLSENSSWHPNALISNFGVAAGVGMLLYGFLTGWGLNIITWRSALVTVIGTIVVIQLSKNAEWVARRVLCSTPLVSTGLISYSLYLWHWPVIVYARFSGIDDPWAMLAASFVFAGLSYTIVERPARAARDRRFVAVVSSLLAITLAAVALPFVVRRATQNIHAPVFLHEVSLDPDNEDPKYQNFHGTRKIGLSVFDSQRLKADAVLFGDSHSIMYFPAVLKTCEKLDMKLTFFGAGATSPFFVESIDNLSGYGDWDTAERLAFDEARKQFLQENKPSVVFICARWTLYSTSNYNWSAERFRRHLVKLREICGEAACIFVGQPPELLVTTDFTGEFSASHDVVAPVLRSYRETESSRSQRFEVHALLREFCEVTRDCYFLGTECVYMRDGLPVLFDAGQILYIDGDHLSTDGASRSVALMVDAVADIRSRREHKQSSRSE